MSETADLGVPIPHREESMSAKVNGEVKDVTQDQAASTETAPRSGTDARHDAATSIIANKRDHPIDTKGDEPLVIGADPSSSMERDPPERKKDEAIDTKESNEDKGYFGIPEEPVKFPEERTESAGDPFGTPSTKTPPPPLPQWVVLPEMKFMTWERFSLPLDPHNKHMIDILAEEPVFLDSERRLDARLRERSKGLVGRDPATTDRAEAEGKIELEFARIRGKVLPERIRINSWNTMFLLQEKLIQNATQYDPQCHSIMLRPFKSLLQYQDSIKRKMDEVIDFLEEVIASRGAQADGIDGEEGTMLGKSQGEETLIATEIPLKDVDQKKKNAGQGKITWSEWLSVFSELGLGELPYESEIFMCEWPTVSSVQASFDCLKDLIDNYLAPVSAGYRDRKSDTAPFHDLWHVFQTGDIILSRPTSGDGHIASKQALGVLRTTGGRRVISKQLSPPVLSGTAIPEAEQIHPIGGINPFCIDAYYLDHNGQALIPVRQRFFITPYVGEFKISDLAVYPIEYSTSADETFRSLKTRGEKFVELATSKTPLYRDCVGLDLRTREELNDKIIVDMKEYLKRHPTDMPSFKEPGGLDLSETNDCNIADCRNAHCSGRSAPYINDQHVDQTAYLEFRDDRVEFERIVAVQGSDQKHLPDSVICHYRVFAYKLRFREWIEVSVDDIETPKEIDHEVGFNLLVLPSDHKRILESQIREHFRKRGVHATTPNAEDDMDLVRGKGQGLIILLHGAPGVGKTCTAECIADLMKKPLYPITCGDLGSTADAVEQGLKKHFALASRWDCVMLLDEADVFLAKRKQEDLRRNSIVSVFLRMLEYYKGLLFLTTNRVGSFDEAFKSRVHISLFYPNFDRRTTIKVWKTFLKQTKRALESSGKKEFTIDKDGILEFAEQHFDENPKAQWNGRQIRNAFHTAVAMAEFDARKALGLTYDDNHDVNISIIPDQLEKIAKTAREFDEYMAETVKATWDDKAYNEGMRALPKTKTESKTARKLRKNKKQSSSSASDSSSDSDPDEKPKTKSSRKTAKQSKKKKNKKQKAKSNDDNDSDEPEVEVRSEKARRKSVVQKPEPSESSEEETEESD